MKRKILAFALAFLMLVSVLPTSVFAADAHEHAECKGEKHTLATCPEATQIGEPVAPACGKEGYTLFECPDCGDYFADNFVAKLGEHVKGEQVSPEVPAYCGIPGKTAVYKCANCKEKFGGEPIKALTTTHNYKIVESESTSNTCTVPGKLVEKCEHCGHKKSTDLGAPDHTWTKHPIIDVEPKVNQAGSAHYECTVCGEKSEPIEIKAVCSHKLVEHKLDPAECGVPGMEAYNECTFCDVLYWPNGVIVEDEEELIIPALEHVRDTKSEPIEVVAADCTTDGYIVCKCRLCGEEFQIETEKAHHEYGDEPSYIELPTCDKYGVKIYICLICGVPDIVQYQDPLGHGAWEDALAEYVDANLKAMLNATYTAAISWYTYDVIFTLADGEGYEGTVAIGRNGNNTTYEFTYTAADGIVLTLDGEATADYVLTMIPAENGIGFSGIEIENNKGAAELEAGMSFTQVGSFTVKVEGPFDPMAWMQPQTPDAGSYTIPETGTYVFDFDDMLFYLYLDDGSNYPETLYAGDKYEFTKGDVINFITEIADATGAGEHEVTVSMGAPSLEMPVCTLKQTLADCTNPGSREYVCGVCNKVVTVIGKTAEELAESEEKPTELDAVGHAWRTVFVTDATCTTYSYFYRHCVNEQCSLATVGEILVPQNGEYIEYNFCHDPENPTKVMKASEGGVASRIERNDDGSMKVTYGTTLNPDKHVYDEATINEPTCTEPGDMVYHCVFCTKYIHEILPALDHDMADPEVEDEKEMIIRIESTCGRQGFVLTPCTREGCEVNYTAEQIKYLTLAYSILLPNEEIPEFTTGVHFEIEILPAVEVKEHYSMAEAVAMHTLKKNIMYGMDMGYDYETIRAGGCEEVGLQKYFCTDCNQYLLVVIDGTGEGHVKPTAEELAEQIKIDPVYGFYQAPTCTEWGRYAYYQCTVCGETCDQWANCEDEAKYPSYSEYTTIANRELTTIDPECPVAGEHTFNEWLSSPCMCKYTTTYTAIVKQIAPLNHTIKDEFDAIDKKTYKEVKPTCTEPGMTGAWYCELCQMWSADEGATWVEKDPRKPIEETKHANFDIVEAAGSTDENPLFCAAQRTCTQFGYALFKCNDCDYYFIDDYAVATGHSAEPSEDTLISVEDGGCLNPSTYWYACKWCTQYSIVKEAPGHVNKDGEKIETSCTFTGDRKCDACKETIAVTHDNKFTTQVPATCKDYGYDLVICQDCKVWHEVTNIDDTYLADHSYVHNVKKPASYIETGLCEDICSVCKDKVEHVLPVLTGVEFIAKIENAAVAGAGFADSTLVKITVSLASATKAEVSSLGFDLSYDKTVLNFVEAKFVSETFTTMCMANDNGDFVTVVANVPNNADKTAANTVIEGEQALVELYFRVNNATAEETTVSFNEIEIRNAEKKALKGDGADASMEIVKFMDFNADGDVNLADIMFAYDVMAGLAEATYDVTVDMDKDGDIDVEDITYLYEYYAGIKSYEDVIKLGVPETVPAA